MARSLSTHFCVGEAVLAQVRVSANILVGRWTWYIIGAKILLSHCKYYESCRYQHDWAMRIAIRKRSALWNLRHQVRLPP
jgi:hypothetical protein